MKHNITSTFDEKTGISTVTLKNKYGTFIGTAKCHEKDRDIMSSFRGCRYAETRAWIQYYKCRARWLNGYIHALTVAHTAICQSKDCDEFSPEARRIRKQVGIYRKEMQWFLSGAKEAEKNLNLTIQTDDLKARSLQDKKN